MSCLRFVLGMTVLGLASVSASAQARTSFDTLSEGTSAPTLVTPAGTFLDLVLDDQGTPGDFVVEDASGLLTGRRHFTAPNALAFGAFQPGPGAVTTPVRSFRILLAHPATAVQLSLYHQGGSLHNSISLRFYSSGTLAYTWTIMTGHSTYQEARVHTCTPSMPVDEIRVTGSGLDLDTRFRALIDNLVISNAPCGYAPEFCAANGSAACPCGNAPVNLGGLGCLNSTGEGAGFDTVGMASLTVDEVTLRGYWFPPFAPGLLVATSNPGVGVTFGDGVSCLGSSPMRVVVRQADVYGRWDFPVWGTPSLSQAALITTPGTRSFQIVYRDNAAFCTSSVFNVSRGVTLTYAP